MHECMYMYMYSRKRKQMQQAHLTHKHRLHIQIIVHYSRSLQGLQNHQTPIHKPHQRANIPATSSFLPSCFLFLSPCVAPPSVIHHI